MRAIPGSEGVGAAPGLEQAASTNISSNVKPRTLTQLDLNGPGATYQAGSDAPARDATASPGESPVLRLGSATHSCGKSAPESHHGTPGDVCRAARPTAGGPSADHRPGRLHRRH